MRRMLNLSGVMLLCVPPLLADLPTLTDATPVAPRRVAIINSSLQRVSPWIDYQPGGIAAGCAETLTYDAMDAGGDYGLCPRQGFYFNGLSYCNMYTVDDMRVGPGTEGVFSERVILNWRWNPQIGGNPSESCLIALFTAEDASSTCVLPAIDNVYDGVLFDFGDLPPGNGYWYSDVELCDAGLGHQMPVDGAGGFLQIFAQQDTGSSFILATCAQPMLWGTKHPDNNLPGTSPFYSGPVHWDDDNAPFGELDLDECFGYVGSECPNPLSTAIAFYYNSGECDGFLCGDANCDGTFDGADIDAFFLAVGDPVVWWIQFSTCNLLCVADINGDDSADGGDIDAFFLALQEGHCP